MHFLIVWNIFFEMQHKRLFPDDETIPERENRQQTQAVIISKSLVNQRVYRFYLQEQGQAAAYRIKDDSKAACNTENPAPTWMAAHKNCNPWMQHDWLTDRRHVQSESATWLTDRRFDQLETLLCLSSHRSVPSNLADHFPPSMVGFGFSILRVRGLGLLRILAFLNKKSVYFLSIIYRPSLSLLDRKDKHCYSAMLTKVRLRRYSILSSNTNYYLNAKIAGCTRLKFLNQLSSPPPQESENDSREIFNACYEVKQNFPNVPSPEEVSLGALGEIWTLSLPGCSECRS